MDDREDQYELQNLLEESSSDEEGNSKNDGEDEDSDDSWANETPEDGQALKESDFHLESEDQIQDQQLLMMEEEKDDLES